MFFANTEPAKMLIDSKEQIQLVNSNVTEDPEIRALKGKTYRFVNTAQHDELVRFLSITILMLSAPNNVRPYQQTEQLVYFTWMQILFVWNIWL